MAAVRAAKAPINLTKENCSRTRQRRPSQAIGDGFGIAAAQRIEGNHLERRGYTLPRPVDHDWIKRAAGPGS